MLGAGGREHALVWKLAQSPRVADILVAPGSDGMAREPKTRCAPIAVGAVRELAELAAREAVDLTVVGPEQPLVAGLADAFQARGLAVFGPARGPAQLEGSKAFAKDFMVKHTIPTARYRVFDKADDAFAFMTHEQMPFVVKADGLASGKGVVVPATTAQSLEAVRAMAVWRRGPAHRAGGAPEGGGGLGHRRRRWAPHPSLGVRAGSQAPARPR